MQIIASTARLTAERLKGKSVPNRKCRSCIHHARIRVVQSFRPTPFMPVSRVAPMFYPLTRPVNAKGYRLAHRFRMTHIPELDSMRNPSLYCMLDHTPNPTVCSKFKTLVPLPPHDLVGRFQEIIIDRLDMRMKYPLFATTWGRDLSSKTRELKQERRSFRGMQRKRLDDLLEHKKDDFQQSLETAWARYEKQADSEVEQ